MPAVAARATFPDRQHVPVSVHRIFAEAPGEPTRPLCSSREVAAPAAAGVPAAGPAVRVLGGPLIVVASAGSSGGGSSAAGGLPPQKGSSPDVDCAMVLGTARACGMMSALGFTRSPAGELSLLWRELDQA